MAKRETTRTQQYGCEHNKQDTSIIPPVSSFASPTPPQFTGGAAFPDSAPQIFSLPQNTLTLLFNALKLQPQNFGMWRRLKRIFAMLAKKCKEAKEALREFWGFGDDDGDEVGVGTKVLLMRNWLEKCLEYLQSKPPPAQVSTVWCAPAVPRLSRAPNTAACLAWRVAG